MSGVDLNQIGRAAQRASSEIGNLDSLQKNQILLKFADALKQNQAKILNANQLDLASGQVAKRFIDRLTLTPDKIKQMAVGLQKLVALNDPIGLVDTGWRTENGLMIIKQRVPIGVVGIIYESRPNVTVDAAGLCFKSGNAVILRGGKESLHSNIALAQILRDVLKQNALNPDIIQIIEDPSHQIAQQFMELNDYVDVLIPRGSARLIKTVVQYASVPVIETGAGNCHIYVDQSAELAMATKIIINGKVQRPSVCNSTEKLLIHQSVAEQFLPTIIKELRKNGVEVRGDKRSKQIVPDIKLATEQDWSTEYNDLIIAVKVVDSNQAAIDHINRFGTHHSEVIVTDNYQSGINFQKQVDAACVYVNASSRFTDGFEFGFGAEIGISTQKLHARGPMGLNALTSYKYIINGNGQIRK